MPASTWLLLAALVLSGLATIIAMARTGIDVFWASPAPTIPRVGLIEVAPIGLLLILCCALTAGAGPVMAYMQAAAEALHVPQDYLQGVLATSAPDPGSGG